MAILIPAYKEDSVIEECVHSCINQNYPKDLYDTVVISDQMQESTLEILRKLPIKIVEVSFKNSTKSKALNFAMAQIEDYDIAVILDADNVIPENFLHDVNIKFDSTDAMVVQAHRIAKNFNNDMALLDAASEEINNSIFRKAHSALGLSAALIGSGMAFDYSLFKSTMLTVDAVGGFDKALELTLTYNKERIHYLHNTIVLDEKVQSSKDFSRQRQRWLSAQLHYFGRFLKFLPKAIKQGNIDFCDKLFQQISIPRLLLLGGVSILSIIVTLISLDASIKWWSITLLLAISLLFAVPKKLYTSKMLVAVVKLPYYFILFFGTIFHLKKANKKFIHTSHGIK